MALTRAQRALAAAPQPAQNNPPAPQNPQPAPQQQARPQKPNKKKPTQKKDKAFVPEDDEDANGEGKEDAAPAPKSGRKRPSPAASAVSSSKARKTGDAGPSGRNTPGPGLGQATDKADRAGTQPEELDEAGGAVVEDQGKGKGKGNGKGKEKAVEDTSEDWFMPVDFSGNHEHNMKQAEAFDAARRATLSAWSKQPPDYDSAVWKGATELGAGSYGAAFVFYREDDDGIVIDRIAVKDTVAKKQEWVDWTKWWGNPRDANSREHIEIKVMKDIAPSARDGRCVLWRASTNYDDVFTYRIIMTYCPAGALHDAIPAVYESDKKPNKKKDAPPIIQADGFDVPESLCWKWFEDLAKACELLDTGMDFGDPPNDPLDPRRGQQFIVHRDLKPMNVFLDLPSGKDNHWPAYPVATLGDFGSSMYTREDDENNPTSYNYWQGTPGFRPLELQTVCDPVTKRYINLGKLGSATNVWAAGASIMAVCNREPRPTTNCFDRESAIPKFNDNAQDKYSQTLRDLVSACVSYRPEDRIDVAELLAAISQHTAGAGAGDGDVDLADGMRSGRPTAEEDGRQWRWPKQEWYRLGLSHDEGESLRVAEQKEADDIDAARLQADQDRRIARKNAEEEAAKEVKKAKAAEEKAKRAAAAAAKKEKKKKKKSAK